MKERSLGHLDNRLQVNTQSECPLGCKIGLVEYEDLLSFSENSAITDIGSYTFEKFNSRAYVLISQSHLIIFIWHLN